MYLPYRPAWQNVVKDPFLILFDNQLMLHQAYLPSHTALLSLVTPSDTEGLTP